MPVHLPLSLRRKPSSPTLLVVGCGDIGMRVLRLLRGRWRLLALTSSPARCEALRQAGAMPLLGDLDQPATLARLGVAADAVLHLAPPAPQGATDLRTAHLLQALARGGRVNRLVYGSTTGVYGAAGSMPKPGCGLLGATSVSRSACCGSRASMQATGLAVIREIG